MTSVMSLVLAVPILSGAARGKGKGLMGAQEHEYAKQRISRRQNAEEAISFASVPSCIV